ncbi:FimV/HubP family polar landmark protein [Halopseudomonas salegens]|uniref:Pilus assembly protein FimV n=1 Tax=Halopseudomonas salegens TaxID=1434072 RepID=A0A1H2F244_9GAMM|nr:FimV/HubP family polar landmark protein [Halopseudomonas salegens]SDU01422.1 pilus assembly protein FimV [Halopseudomonas salegens]
MVRKLVIAVAAASALMSGNMAHALGVGDINLRSALNQPLDAEIQLLQVRDLESTEIIPRLASPDDFGRAGIERPFFLTDLTFTPVVGEDGRAFIRVTSNQPVREPFVNFLLEVRWPSGRVLREFTLLIDPPTYQARPVTSPSVTPASASAPASAPRAEQPSRRTDASPARQASTRSSVPEQPGMVTVGQNDTLWVLAQRNRPQNASVHQTMLAIQDLNPDAFIDNNINRLRNNQRLQMPDTQQATQRSQGEAIAAVAQQNADWQSARQAASQRQLDARQRDTAAPAPAESDGGDTLRLVAGNDQSAASATDSGDGDNQQPLRDQLDQAKEQLDAAERERAEMDDRLSEIQGQLETAQRLLELKDAQLAALQEELGATPETPDILPEVDAELADVEAEASELDLTAVQTLDDPRTSAIGPENEQVVTDEMTAPEVFVEEQTPAAEPAAEPADVVAADEPAAPPAETTPETSEGGADAMLQRLLQNPVVLYTGAGLALIVLLLILMALSRRNARREEEMADNFIAQASREQAAEAEQDDDFNVALASFDEEAEDDGEDALVAAEGLLAYGKLDEARDLLVRALEQEPDRSDLRLKLMEVEALRENAAGYAEQGTALRAEGGNEPSLNALDQRFPAVAAAAAALAGAGAVAAETDADNDLADADFFSTDDQAGASSESDELDAEFDLGELAGEDELSSLADSGDNASADELDLDFDLEDGLGDELSRTEPDAESVGIDLEADDLAAELDGTLDTAGTQDDVKTDQQAPADSNLDSLDADFDLSLTDDLPEEDLELSLGSNDETATDEVDELSLPESDDLMLDWSLDDDAVEGTDSPVTAPDTLETARAETGDNDSLSDDELLDFESEFNAAMSEDDASTSLDAEETAESTADALEATPEQPVDAQTQTNVEKPADMDASMDDDDDFDFLSGTDETATKLDLARAYVEMGDQEGARDILNEVVDEGSEQQQQEARGLLEQLDN